MTSFVERLQNILVSKWFAVVLISLLLSCLSIFPIANASAQTCGWNWDILSISGIKTNYHSGETISGNISFRLNNAANSSAIQQLLIGIIDLQNKVIDVKCLYNGVPKTCPAWTTGTASFSLKTPVTPGNYKVIAADYLEYSCSDAINKFPSLYSPTSPYCKDITTITISAPSPPPPPENASAQACGGNWDISSTSGIKTNYQLGETISGNISFKINNPSDCPSCTQQILVGLVDSQNKVIDVKCVYDGIPKVCPLRTTGTVSVSWVNPASPGTYRILATQDAKPNFRPKESYKNIATITVSASGSGTPQGGGASKTGISTQFIIVAIALLVLLFIFSLMGLKALKGFIRFIFVLAVISFLGYLFWQYGIPVISKWIRENLSTIIGVLLSLGALAIAGIAIWKNWDRIRIEKPLEPIPPHEPEEPDIDQLCNKIIDRINSFSVPSPGRKENYYHQTLFQWLKSKFPNAAFEKQMGRVRIDIVIGNIAIEVKGPTRNSDLDDLPNKISYLNYCKKLICVLFERDYDDSEFDRIANHMKQLRPNKIFFIQK